MTLKNDDAKLKEGLRLKITKNFNLDQFVTNQLKANGFYVTKLHLKASF
jgi:hypothetical protein